MSEVPWIIAAATLVLAIGLWLMLPRSSRAGRSLGTLLVAVALGLIASQIPWLGNWANSSVFYVLATVTVFSAVSTITFRNPVYSALWFALSLLGTAALFLFSGAQFLGVATIVVYAGAILVTFLFVLMLAQPEGHAFYDRISWQPALSAITGALMVGILTLTLTTVFQNEDPAKRPSAGLPQEELKQEILADQHVAHLGAVLFSQHLVAVEVAGTLLLVALVAAAAIIERIRTLDREAAPAGRISHRGGPSHG